MGLLNRSDPDTGDYLLVRAETADGHALRHGRGMSTHLLQPDQIDGAYVISKVVIEPDTEPGPFHLHEHATNIYIGLLGITEVRVGADSVELGPFDLIFIPAGVPHSTHNPGKQPVSVLAMYDRSVKDDFVVVGA